MERERLGLSQEALATACGVTRRTQVNYERDVHPPAVVYLDKLAGLGVDTEFVMTGGRSGQHDAAIRASLALLDQLLIGLGFTDVQGILDKAASISAGTSKEYSGSGIAGFAANILGQSKMLQDSRILAKEQAEEIDLSILASAIELIADGASKRALKLDEGKQAVLIAQVYVHAMANGRALNGKQADQLFSLMT
jgi:transcriptional regulator with XRE-family HTH domain